MLLYCRTHALLDINKLILINNIYLEVTQNVGPQCVFPY